MLVKKSKEKLIFNMVANLITGIMLVVTGIILNAQNSTIIENRKALFGLSLITFGAAFYSWINLFFIKKFPKGMKPIIVSENDERNVALRNEADAITFQVLRWLLLLVFFGYTFMVPKDIFESLAWWIVFIFFFLSYVLQAIFLRIKFGKNKNEENI